MAPADEFVPSEDLGKDATDGPGESQRGRLEASHVAVVVRECL